MKKKNWMQWVSLKVFQLTKKKKKKKELEQARKWKISLIQLN